MKKNKLTTIDLIWQDGDSCNLGYNTSINQPIEEKEKISSSIEKYLKIHPEKKSIYEDNLSFEWSDIVIYADQKSLSCITKIYYK